ncbi:MULTISPECIES: hypothetical protein [unclassified Serratia (in: enterobacteria)]|uniref:hypothetical protein n=1 Tax=unclassified Serratia (in: enterobacteria) TaxID=2647522 RepID=UPI002ED1DD5E|nr:hypothetical protein [Serratia sp. C2(2)]MEE4446030.1 hypothetical protein [Serratia sp. C2(1)]
MPFVILLDNDFIRFTRLSAQWRKSLPKKEKTDGAIEEGKTALFMPLPESEKKIKNF